MVNKARDVGWNIQPCGVALFMRVVVYLMLSSIITFICVLACFCYRSCMSYVVLLWLCRSCAFTWFMLQMCVFASRCHPHKILPDVSQSQWDPQPTASYFIHTRLFCSALYLTTLLHGVLFYFLQGMSFSPWRPLPLLNRSQKGTSGGRKVCRPTFISEHAHFCIGSACVSQCV